MKSKEDREEIINKTKSIIYQSIIYYLKKNYENISYR